MYAYILQANERNGKCENKYSASKVLKQLKFYYEFLKIFLE